MAASLRSAINAKCKECIYDPVGGKGTWRQQVEACTSRSCPLFAVRPLPSHGFLADGGLADEKRAELAPEAA